MFFFLMGIGATSYSRTDYSHIMYFMSAHIIVNIKYLIA